MKILAKIFFVLSIMELVFSFLWQTDKNTQQAIACAVQGTVFGILAVSASLWGNDK